ncbi:MAG: secretin N-terminal domain-containing protein [Elusimicrobiota bacterium]
MMTRHGRGRKFGLGRAAAAVAVSLSMLLDGAPAFAQRRKAEPEVNPDFQNALKTKGDGGPVADSGAGSGETVTEPASSASDSGGGEEKVIESRSVQSVQIGAAPAARAAAVSATAPLDTRVTVRVKGAPLATFLDTISAQAKVNFIITEGLEQKRVTAFLQNVTVREALQVLLEIKGLTYQQIGKSNTYVVTQRSKQAENLITRIYTLSFVPLIPLSDDLADEKAAALVGGAAAAGSGGGQQKPCLSKNQKISIARVVCTVLSKTGDIELEPRTNALIVTDIPEVFPQVEQIIAELDKKAPQVMIEAQIVEIDSERTRNLGFEWGGTNGELGSFTGGMRDTSFPLNLPHNLTNTQIFDPLLPNGVISSLGTAATASSTGGTGTNTGPVIGSFLKTSVLDLTQLKITLRALVQRSEARFLGKPKIMTLNNKTATIEIASTEAVAIQSSITGGQGTSQASTTAERYETGVILKVTPQINKEGYITMLIQPTFTDVQEAAISQASNRIFNPVKRTAITMVRVKNGQTLVLGGLLRSAENKVTRKVPFLGYIPIIGWLFTSDLTDRKNTDLVIFLTPTIVSD